jgi:hypothetical protein
MVLINIVENESISLLPNVPSDSGVDRRFFVVVAARELEVGEFGEVLMLKSWWKKFHTSRAGGYESSSWSVNLAKS